jgi:hypothetical protein
MCFRSIPLFKNAQKRNITWLCGNVYEGNGDMVKALEIQQMGGMVDQSATSSISPKMRADCSMISSLPPLCISH